MRGLTSYVWESLILLWTVPEAHIREPKQHLYFFCMFMSQKVRCGLNLLMILLQRELAVHTHKAVFQ